MEEQIKPVHLVIVLSSYYLDYSATTDVLLCSIPLPTELCQGFTHLQAKSAFGTQSALGT